MDNGDEKLILAGDIGGTKSYLGLFISKDGALTQIDEERYINKDFSSVEDVLVAFKKRVGRRKITSSSLGVACPVVENRCTLTNMTWDIDAEELREVLGIPVLAVINDLVATGWGVKLLGTDDLYTLQEGYKRNGNAALIAAGTGLGEAILFGDGESSFPSGSEGGHTDFAPRNDVEIELLNSLRAEYGHVSYERILSGPGLKTLYDFFRARSGKPVPERMEKRFVSGESAASVVSSEALSGGDEEAIASLKLFISIYGAEAGNLALKSMATAGVYIGGGIAPKILDAIKADSTFIDSFTDKGRFKEFMERLPVYVILNEKTALLGAALHASLLKA